MDQIPPHVSVAFDSCAFAPPVESEKRATKKLLDFIEEHEVTFSIPQAVLEETGRAPSLVRNMAHAYIFDYDMFNTPEEQRELAEVKSLLFGTRDELSEGERNDVRNLLCAKKYCCTYFVTFDKRHILGRHDEIRSRLGVEVATPSQCLDRLRRYLE